MPTLGCTAVDLDPTVGFMLPRYSLTQTCRPVQFFVDSEELDLEPPYQRRLVWGTPRKIALIRSLLMGLPVGDIVLNDRYPHAAPPADVPMYAVVDGKQRVNAVRDFVAGAFAVPADWFPDEHLPGNAGDRVLFSGLAAPARRRFRNIGIAVYLAAVPGVEAEREVFEHLNQGGVPQGDTDL